jgi:hypothetical protein
MNGKHPSLCRRPEHVIRWRHDLIGIGRASLLVWWMCWMGCGAPAAAPPREPAPAPAPESTEPERQGLTSEQCEAQGGEIVGDIGDGATRRPDYLCPGGKPPTGNVAPPEGGPMPVEGAVCCPR